MSKRTWCSVLGIFFLFIPIWADEDVFRHPLRAEYMDSFSATSNLLAKHPIVKGAFEQEKILGRLGRSLKSSGNFIIVSDLGMVWDTLKPFPSTMALGKDFLIQSRQGGQKTVLSAAGNETFLGMAEVLSAVFSGDTRGLLDNFEVYFSGIPSEWKMGLLPRSKAIAGFADRITLNGDAAIRSIVVYEQNGDAIKYVLSNHNYPLELSVHEKSFFQ